MYGNKGQDTGIRRVNNNPNRSNVCNAKENVKICTIAQKEARVGSVLFFFWFDDHYFTFKDHGDSSMKVKLEVGND